MQNSQNNLSSDSELNLKIEDILKKYKKFRRKDINFLIKKKAINNPLTVQDLYFLDRLYRIWRDNDTIRLMIAGKRLSEIKKTIDYLSAGCETKIDIWLYSRIKNKKELGEKVYITALVFEAIRLFKLKKNSKTIKQLTKQAKKIKNRIKAQLKKRNKKT